MKAALALILILKGSLSIAQQAITWSVPLPIAGNTYGNQHPRITTDASGNPLVLWGRSGSNDVLFSRWSGNAFTTPVVLNPLTIPVFAASWAGPDLTSKGDTVYVVYKGTPEDTSHIYLVSSFDGGVNFSSPSRVDFIADSVCRFPTVTTDTSGNPVVAFMKFNATFGEARWVVTRSLDCGLTYTTDVKASGWTGGFVCDCCPGSLAGEGSRLAMIYRANISNIRDIWTGISNDGGATFANGWNIDQNNWMLMMCPSSGPDGIIIGDSLYTVFMNGASGINRVFSSVSSISNGQSNPVQPLTVPIPGLSDQQFPRIAHDGNAVAIAWKQNVNGIEQLVIRFTNDITNGLPVAYDTVALNNITNADIGMANNAIHVVWEDANTGTVKYRIGSYTASATGIDFTKYLSDVNCYPNPASTHWTIENVADLSPSAFTLYNTWGIEIKAESILQNKRVTISCSRLPKGIYFLKINTAHGYAVKKLLLD